jgi:methionyl-tRNA formyltransferase
MNIKLIKVIFLGTPDFAVPSLEKLINHDYYIIEVITQPDKKVGRKQEIIPSAVKKAAVKLGLPFYQPDNIKNINAVKYIKSLKPDFIITCAYGQIIPKSILDIPKFGCINIHGSLLPKYRGASPIQYAILKGDKKTGITVMEMDEKMDEGDIISQKSIKIESNDTASSLHDKLSVLGANLLIETLPKILNKEIKYTPQNDSQATYTKILKKEDGKIDWNKNADEIDSMIRAFYPWPGTYAELKNSNHESRIKRLKIIRASLIKIKNNLNPGTIFKTKDENLAVKCKINALILEKIQPEGKKVMSGQEFIRGYNNILNKIIK